MLSISPRPHAVRISRSTLTRSARLSFLKAYSTNADADANTIVHVPRCNVYRFGQVNAVSEPIFKDLEWTVKEGENWAIVGSAGNEKSDLLSMLMGYARLSPPPPSGLYPFLSSHSPPIDPHSVISLVSFTSRPSSSASFSFPSGAGGGGAFFDYTARYGAIRDELRMTLRETLFSQVNQKGAGEKGELEDILERLDLKDLLDLPFVVLSNGQTRRARIAKALLGTPRPEMLLLDEPLTGLDTAHRPQLTSLLHDLHLSRKPRILMALRPQDPLPEWITHVAVVERHNVRAGMRSQVGAMMSPARSGKERTGLGERMKSESRVETKQEGKELVAMKDVNVRYHGRHVLKNITWTIRSGEKWFLQGPNGSGKTTLLSLILGTHPQSFSLPLSSLSLFSIPRRQQPTVTLQHRIGHVSPEVFSAFPRKGGQGGMSVREVVGTGFEGVFAYRPLSPVQAACIDELIKILGPSKWSSTATEKDDEAFGETKFTSLPPSHQSLALLLRALVSRPPLLILDEPFAGMDSRMISAVKAYLREDPGLQRTSVVFVSHWEDEIPWDPSEVRRIKLKDGEAEIIYG